MTARTTGRLDCRPREEPCVGPGYLLLAWKWENQPLIVVCPDQQHQQLPATRESYPSRQTMNRLLLSCLKFVTRFRPGNGGIALLDPSAHRFCLGDIIAATRRLVKRHLL